MSTTETNGSTDRRMLLTAIASSELPTPVTTNIGRVIFLHFDLLADLKAWAEVVGAREFKTRELKHDVFYSYWDGGRFENVPVVLTASEPVGAGVR